MEGVERVFSCILGDERMGVIAVCPIHLELVELREGGELRSSGSREELTEANRHRAFCEALWSQSSEACTYPQGRNDLPFWWFGSLHGTTFSKLHRFGALSL